MKHDNVNKKKQENNSSDKDDNDRFVDKEAVTHNAREEALDDIAEDADLSIHSPNDDLDEGETARLGEDKTDLV